VSPAARQHQRSDIVLPDASSAYPLVSVIIPTHNYAKYLPEAIESALTQDYSPLEIIVIDDGSTDATRVAVEAYREQGVEYVYQENSGPGPARNEGIRRARGDVVAFLDADDSWLPEKISMQMAHLRAHPDLGLVGSAGFDCDSTNRPTGVRAAPAIAAEMAFERLVVRNFIQPSGVIVRKRCLDEVGGFKNMRFGEDWDLWLRISQRYPIGFVQKPLFMRREHAANLSSEVGQQLRAKAAREQPGEVEDPDVSKRQLAHVSAHPASLAPRRPSLPAARRPRTHRTGC